MLPRMKKAVRRVGRLVEAAGPLEHIELQIDGMSKLTPQEKALVWLFAWAGADPVTVARELGCPLVLDADDSLSVT